MLIASLKTPPNVLILTEHWLKYDNVFLLDRINGYNLAAYHLRPDRVRGGVCLLVGDSLSYTTIDSISRFNVPSVLECCAATVKFSLNVVVLGLYRPPHKHKAQLDCFFKTLDDILKFLRLRFPKHKLIVSGDFNINILSFGEDRNNLLSILQSYNLNIHILNPTRIGPTSSTCIDNIISDIDISLCNSIVFETGLSDHLAQYVCFSNLRLFDNNSYPEPRKRIFSFHNINNFVSNLKDESWQEVYSLSSESNANVSYNKFLEIFLLYFHSAFPLVKKCKRKSIDKSWITKGIKISCARKRELHSLAKESCDPNFLLYVKRYKQIFKRCVNAAKKMHNNNLIFNSNNKQKTTWDIVKRETKRVPVKRQINLEVRGRIVTDRVTVSSAFNTYFSTTCNRLNISPDIQEALNGFETKQPPSSFSSFEPLLIHDTLKLISEIKPSKSAGWDGIPPFLLKACANIIAEPLTHVINMSLQTGSFPDSLKHSSITPIFKKGNPTDIENYRPISILPAFSKVFEKAALKPLESFFENNRLLYNFQFGFRKNKNVQSALYTFVNEISSAVDESQSAVAVFCDLSKAFDCVNHKLLIHKLLKYGIKGKVLNWLSSYLNNRKQQVIIEVDTPSGYLPVQHGVPQGSILGPLLFIIYSNDLPQCISNSLAFTYADDTTIFIKNTIRALLLDNLITDFNSLKHWFSVNGLLLNEEKTFSINFHSNYQNCFRADDSYLRQVMVSSAKGKFLGLHMESTVTWGAHVSGVSTSLNKAHYAILVLSKITDLKTLLTVYHAYVFSHLTYGVILWGNSTHAQIIFRIQKKIVRVISNAPRRSSCKQIFSKLNILPFPCIYIYQTLLFVKRNPDLFPNNRQTTYATRNIHNITLPPHRTASFQKSPKYMGIKLFNRMPVYLKQEQSLQRFKTLLREFLMGKLYYSINEYLSG